MREFLKISCIVLAVMAMSACREDFSTTLSSGNLSFSKDTVYLDTVFSNIGSSTYQFKVYNPSDESISIPQVELARGEASKFRLNVNGRAGKRINDVEILAKDSIFVFVEVTADINEVAQNTLEFLYTDQINFNSVSQSQQVELVSLIKDAVFLFPERFEDGTTETLSVGLDANGDQVFLDGFFLTDEELSMTNQKPYVIYGFAAVPPNKTLNIQAGARLHFHDGSGLIAANEASIQAVGDYSLTDALENEIIFESDRLEPEFAEVPGQWSSVWLTAGSTNHIFDHVTIKNSTVGILMDSNDGSQDPTLQLKNTKIYNSSNVGLLARTGYITAQNLVINNAGQAAVNLSLGGQYEFKHSTLVNYWQNSFRNFPAVLIENELVTQEQTFVADLNATFSNCIIYGNENIELQFSNNENAAFNLNIDNTLVRFNDFNNAFEDNVLYDFSNPSIYSNIILNQTPEFLDPFTNQLLIGQDSPAAISGNTTTGNQVPLDLLGEDRTTMPNLGAYQSKNFEDE